MSILVLYHANCVDGFVAALQAYQVLGKEDVTYRPHQYGEDVPEDLLDYDKVYLLDYSLPVINDNMVIIDHHKTLGDRLIDYVGNAEIIYDPGFSGAYLAHKYFGTPGHWLIDYAQDRDLWKWELPNSKAISAGLSLLPLDPEELESWIGMDRDAVYWAGVIILKYVNLRVKSLVCKALDFNIKGNPCKILNNGQWISEVGEKIDGLIAQWFMVDFETAVISLRGPGSRSIAESFGGGGHDLAAGFKIDLVRLVSGLRKGVLV